MGFDKAIRKGLHAVDKALTGRGHGAASKFFKYAYPFNGLYLGRKAWNSLQKRLSPVSSASGYAYSGGGSPYGVSGSIREKM